MPVIPFEEFNPNIADSAFIAPGAWITGKVKVGARSSIFFGASLRGDINEIIIGEGSNIQDNAVLHTSRGLGPCVVGDLVTVGHCATLHGCTIMGRCIVGMNSVVLDEAVIEENCIIGANSLVTMRTRIPAGSLVFGSPAKVIRQLNERELKEIGDSAKSYIDKSAWYKNYFMEKKLAF